MKTLIEFNYQITKNRGLIDNTTNIRDFVLKLEEESQEWIDTAINDKSNFDYELADIILVCLNISRHYGIDIEKQLLVNILNNSKR